jgi:hypothetical protein
MEADQIDDQQKILVVLKESVCLRMCWAMLIDKMQGEV